MRQWIVLSCAVIGLLYAVPSQAALSINGIRLNGIHLNGVKLNGVKINGIAPNGAGVVAEGAGQLLAITLPSGAILRPGAN